MAAKPTAKVVDTRPHIIVTWEFEVATCAAPHAKTFGYNERAAAQALFDEMAAVPGADVWMHDARAIAHFGKDDDAHQRSGAGGA